MCMDCGCHQPNDDHGNPEHITYSALQRAARASGIDPQTAAERIQAEAKRMSEGGRGR
ncbi:MAG TPA: hypothetical protein VH916_10450 [Dehalococcoidia bacterium]|jgi:hypothetical protein